jgi:hypothetical protein
MVEETTVPVEETPVKNAITDKEINFRKQEQMFQRMLAEKEARIEELQLQRSQPSIPNPNYDDEDENDDEPYVDRKKLKKAFSQFEGKVKKDTKQDIQTAVAQALSDERRTNWLESNPDFEEVMSHAEKFAQKAPNVAKSILNMPEGFERNKLVYETIKTMGMHKPAEETTTIQGTVDKNRRTPGYQPSGMAGAGYSSQGDFSPAGQKNAYEKLMELKRNLRI